MPQDTWVSPPELAQPLPRKTALSLKFFVHLTCLLLLLCSFLEWHRNEDIMQIGLLFIATVIYPLVALGNLLQNTYSVKKLLKRGNVAAAYIIDEKLETGYTGKLFWTISYMFVDANGVAIKDEQHGSTSAFNKTAEDHKKQFAKITNNPTAMYDPVDSSKHMLYPSAYVVCKEGRKHA